MLVVLGLLPLLFQNAYFRSILVTTEIYALLALSMDLLFGYLGAISLGQAVFLGVGAYASTLLSMRAGWPFWLSAPAALALCALIALGIGYLSMRTLTGIYFAIATFAFAEIFRIITVNWVDLTRGSMGISNIPAPALGSFTFASDLSQYYLVLVVVALCLLGAERLIHSPYGRAFQAIREHPALALSVGVPVVRVKVLCFVLSGIIAGAAGVMYAHHYRIISPELFSLSYDAHPLIAVMIGGRGTLYGPVIGSLILVVLPELLRAAGNIRLLVFGALMLLSILFMPEGIVPAILRRSGGKSRNVAG